MRTPESPAGKPFKITMIQDASTWRHDFKDGRGNILAYGHWFLRLETPGHSGIGIHGSTNNESSVPGRASEGCIRLRDADIITLKEKYAYVGMPVIIKSESQGLFPWEKK
jgi:lipoprotein-anchoring transpeptidase ErfK/SrfK